MKSLDSREAFTGGAKSSLRPARGLVLGALLLSGVIIALLMFLRSRNASTEGSAVAQPPKPDFHESAANSTLSAPVSDSPSERTATEPLAEAPVPESEAQAVVLPGQANEMTIRTLHSMRHSLKQMDDGLAGAPLVDVANSALSAVASAMIIELDITGQFTIRDPAEVLNARGRTPRPPGTHMLAGGGRTYVINDADYPDYIAIGTLCDDRREDAKSAPPLENELLYMRPVPAELIDAIRARCAHAERLLGAAAQER